MRLFGTSKSCSDPKASIVVRGYMQYEAVEAYFVPSYLVRNPLRVHAAYSSNFQAPQLASEVSQLNHRWSRRYSNLDLVSAAYSKRRRRTPSLRPR